MVFSLYKNYIVGTYDDIRGTSIKRTEEIKNGTVNIEELSTLEKLRDSMFTQTKTRMDYFIGGVLSDKLKQEIDRALLMVWVVIFYLTIYYWNWGMNTLISTHKANQKKVRANKENKDPVAKSKQHWVERTQEIAVEKTTNFVKLFFLYYTTDLDDTVLTVLDVNAAILTVWDIILYVPMFYWNKVRGMWKIISLSGEEGKINVHNL